MASRYGYPQSDWDKAKEEMRKALIEVARAGQTISYSDLARKVQAVHLNPGMPPMGGMLGEISADEDAEGRGMLSVIVVHKDGDMMPGGGFFELADELGKSVSTREQFWIKELERVYAYWSKA